KMEERHHTHIIIIPNPHFVTPNFKIDRVRDEDAGTGTPSYQMLTTPEAELPYELREKNNVSEQPAVRAIDANLMPP
ncbi:hypothetical protein ABTM82_20275, partial [Acinetobacter baumannii]